MTPQVIGIIKREVHRNPLQTRSKQDFEAVGMFNVPKSTERLEWANRTLSSYYSRIRAEQLDADDSTRWNRWMEKRMV